MDGDRFDNLARSFASTVSRRSALKAAAGVLLARGLPARGLAAQLTCPIFDYCDPEGGMRCVVLEDIDGECICAFRPMAKSQHCSDPTCGSDAECPSGQFCAMGWCSDGLARCHGGCAENGGSSGCTAGTVLCDGSCVDLSTDNRNCGICGNRCPEGGGEDVVPHCRDGSCQCPEDATPACGQDYCASEQNDSQNCGACGNVCPSGLRCCGGECVDCGNNGICCGGRCLQPESGARFCDFCGYLTGWPQGCLPHEICDRGLCAANGEFELQIVVVTCPRYPQIYEMPPVDGPSELIDLLVLEGCQADEGITIEAKTEDGRLIDSCVASGGVCTISGSFSELPGTIAPVGLAAGVVPDSITLTASSEALSGSTRIAPLINLAGTASTGTTAPTDSDVLQPAGDLAYAVKNGDHWDIWVYSFDTLRNTQLTSDPNNDQWAPAYSHDGSQLAFLSDEADGSNQIWIMNPDGSNQRPITSWSGNESIQYVGWSPDDSHLIVTLLGDQRRLVTMPAGGGDFVDFVGPSSSFATTGRNGILAYASDDGSSATTIYLANFDDPTGGPYADGDTPNLTQDGQYVAVQIGDPGSRHIETYTIKVPGHSLPSIPRVGDDSNPVWVVTDHAHLAFVSAGLDGETIQICRVGNDFTTPIEIAPHDRIWYLSKRFAGNGGVPAEPKTPVVEEPSAPEALPTLEPLPVQQESGLAGNSYGGPNEGYEVNWTSAWEVRPEFTGPQSDGSDRLTLWYTGDKVATVDFRSGSILGNDPETCVDETIATLQDHDRFEDNVTPYDAPALTPPSGSAGRTAWNFLQRDYLYTYVECRPLAGGSGLLRIVYQVPDDTYAIVYTDIVTLLAAVETG